MMTQHDLSESIKASRIECSSLHTETSYAEQLVRESKKPWGMGGEMGKEQT